MSTGWEDWTWDESLFRGAAAYYEQGRLPYSPSLADAFTAALNLDGRGRLLDVGCGPGSLTLLLADQFDAAVGVDADAEMLEEARRLAAACGVSNADWVHALAERLPSGRNRFRVITFAASFHWMDRPRVAASARTMLETDGVVVHVDKWHNVASDVPREAIESLRRQYLGPDRRGGASIRDSSPDDEDTVFRGAGFDGPDVVVVPDGRELSRSIDDVVAEVFSSSGTAPHLFGDRKAEFERDLREVLSQAARSDGTFRVTLPHNRLRIWR